MRWGLVGGGRGGEVLVWRLFCLRGLFYPFRGLRNGAGAIFIELSKTELQVHTMGLKTVFRGSLLESKPQVKPVKSFETQPSTSVDVVVALRFGRFGETDSNMGAIPPLQLPSVFRPPDQHLLPQFVRAVSSLEFQTSFQLPPTTPCREQPNCPGDYGRRPIFGGGVRRQALCHGFGGALVPLAFPTSQRDSARDYREAG